MNSQDLNELLKKAMHLQQDDRLVEAEKLFRLVLEQSPDNPDALHGIGLLYAQRKHYREALPWLEKAVQVAPLAPGFHNNLGNLYKALLRPNDAIRHYKEALRLKTPYPEAHNNVGALLYQQGLYDEAIMHLQKSVREAPLKPDTHYNLANCYIQKNRLLDAATHYKEVLRLRPDHLGALHNLGITLTALKDFNQAKPLLEQVVVREPENVDALFHLAVVQAAFYNTNEALQLYERVLKLAPQHSDAHHNYATVLLQVKQPDKALKHYQRAYELNQNNKTALHLVQALMGQSSQQGAPLEYIRALFDQYAFNYDTHVKTMLNYQVPEKMRQAIAPFAAKATKAWTVLDLGCGTGLCAPYFTDVAGKMIGVDISPNMIEVASQKGGYHKLHVDDALNFLIKTQDSYDLIIAADVFVYFAELHDILSAAHKKLTSNGIFVFSVEKCEESEGPFVLRKTGRYAHSASYLQTLLAQVHFLVLFQDETILRKQEDQDVIGYILVIEKVSM